MVQCLNVKVVKTDQFLPPTLSLSLSPFFSNYDPKLVSAKSHNLPKRSTHYFFYIFVVNIIYETKVDIQIRYFVDQSRSDRKRWNRSS